MRTDIVFLKKSGIYKIVNILNNKIYIGSAVDLYNRCSSHISRLRKGIHHSKYLQNSFIKNGEDSFIFEVIELCDKDCLIEREQFYMDLLNPKYNILKIAGSCLGRKVTIETILKIKESKKYYKVSEETKIRCRNTHIERGHKPTKECKEKSVEACKKKVLNLETGQIFNSLKEAASWYNICNKQLSNKLLGKRKNNTNLIYL